MILALTLLAFPIDLSEVLIACTSLSGLFGIQSLVFHHVY